MDLASLAIQVVSGVIVGNAICIAMKQPALNTAARTVVAAIGGVLGGIVFSLIGGDSAISGPLVDFYTGGFGGAIFTPIVGALWGGVLKTRH